MKRNKKKKIKEIRKNKIKNDDIKQDKDKRRDSRI